MGVLRSKVISGFVWKTSLKETWHQTLKFSVEGLNKSCLDTWHKDLGDYICFELFEKFCQTHRLYCGNFSGSQSHCSCFLQDLAAIHGNLIYLIHKSFLSLLFSFSTARSGASNQEFKHAEKTPLFGDIFLNCLFYFFEIKDITSPVPFLHFKPSQIAPLALFQFFNPTGGKKLQTNKECCD